jgi:hypothetical protein
MTSGHKHNVSFARKGTYQNTQIRTGVVALDLIRQLLSKVISELTCPLFEDLHCRDAISH